MLLDFSSQSMIQKETDLCDSFFQLKVLHIAKRI